MKWFETVFLPSLEEQYNQRNGKMWLTEKQVSICKRYMEYSQHIKGALSYKAGSKRYSVQIAPNGCAAFHVENTGAEDPSHKEKREAERRRINAERIERIKRKPERIARETERLNKMLYNYQEQLKWAFEDGDAEIAKRLFEAIEQVEAELALYTA